MKIIHKMFVMPTVLHFVLYLPFAFCFLGPHVWGLCANFGNFFIIPKYSLGFVCLISLAQPLPSPVPCAVTSLSAGYWQSVGIFLLPLTTSQCD